MRLRCELPAIAATTPGVASSAASASPPRTVPSSGLWLNTSSGRPPPRRSSARSQRSWARFRKPRDPPLRSTVSSTSARTAPASNA
jgi:hypothetical protein